MTNTTTNNTNATNENVDIINIYRSIDVDHIIDTIDNIESVDDLYYLAQSEEDFKVLFAYFPEYGKYIMEHVHDEKAILVRGFISSGSILEQFRGRQFQYGTYLPKLTADNEAIVEFRHWSEDNSNDEEQYCYVIV